MDIKFSKLKIRAPLFVARFPQLDVLEKLLEEFEPRYRPCDKK